MNRQIEDYLRARGVRHFRGHHDDEYFFLVDFVSGAYRGRLNVHLEACEVHLEAREVHLESRDAEPGAVLVTVSPDRYYPVQNAQWLGALADRWNSAMPAVAAEVHGSCDPRLVGVVARGRVQAAGLTALTAQVEAAIAAAVELFAQVAALPKAQAAVLRDVG